MDPLSLLRELHRHEWQAGVRTVLAGVLCVLAMGGVVPLSEAVQRDGARNLDSLATVHASPIEQVRTDADENSVPDRVGDTVLVQGRALVRPGALPDSSLIFVQDATAGLAVQLPEGPNVRRGDSLLVRGVVEHQYGLTRIRGLDYRRVATMTDYPSPVPLPVTAAAGESYEGRLVRVRGKVIVNRTNDGGQYVLLEDEAENTEARLAVFVPNRRLDEIDLSSFGPGAEIAVTGVLSQHDRSAPYDDAYQVLPRDQADLEETSFMSGYYQSIIILIIAGAILAATAVFTLRVAVRRRTQQLTESRARFRRLAEATFEGILLHENGKILDVNRALTDMSGYSRQELLGCDVGTIFLDATHHSSPEGTRERSTSPYESVMLPKRGDRFPVEIEEKEVDLADRNVQVVALRNITERKKREKELLQAKEEAENMARLKSSLLNNMSHELRTPVTSIIGYAELIVEEPDIDHTEFATHIQQSGKRLSRTLQAVLDMAKLDSGTIRVSEERVNIESLLREVVNEHRPFASEKGLPIRMDTQGAIALRTDRVLLRRSVSTLVHNAIKFTDEGRVDVTVEPAASGVRIAVADTGIGIAADFRTDLFEPFKQESEGRTRTHQGTGLGLALTKRRIELIGGAIEVESRKGDGSTFTLEFPARLVIEASAAGASSSEIA